MNIVIWLQNAIQMGGGYLNPAINVLNRLYGNINVLGAILPQGININGVKTINDQDLKSLDYDLILVSGFNASLVPIIKKAEELNIDIDKTVLDRTVCIPLFTLGKYNKLRHSQLSILSKNCFGTFIYNGFGLEFLSPTINMFTDTEEQFINFLKDPICNIQKELIFKEFRLNTDSNFNYPVFMLGDTQWNMLHYNDKNFAFIKWYERRYRVNWFNVLIIMQTKSHENLAEFDKLPYSKKICFVPFESELDSAYYIEPEHFHRKDSWQMVHWWMKGQVVHYDIWDALLYGKKTPLVVQK